MANIIKISGKVLQKSDKTPLSGVSLIASSEALGIEIKCTTQQDGIYVVYVEPGRWKIRPYHPGFISPSPVEAAYDADTDNVDFALDPGATLSGTVYWSGSQEPVPGALIQASLKDTEGKTLETCHSSTDEDGDFQFKDLKTGPWTLVTLHAYGLPSKPVVYPLSANTPNFKLELPRIQGTKDQTAGWIFLAALCLSLIVLAITYVALHNRFRQATPTEVQVFLSQVDQAVQQTQDAEKTSASEELATSMTAIRDTWQVISNTVGISQNKTMIASLVGNVEAAIPQDDQSKTLANLQTIRQIITEGIFRIFFWTQEPWRYLEVLLWGLAGILVYLIVRIGYYLRSGRFYREGIYMHISHAFGIPVLALVFVLLLSQVSLTLTITNTQVNLDLTDPRLLAAFSFIIGSQPWYLFDTIRQTAGKVTGREEEPAKPSK